MITHWSTNTLNLVFKGSAIKKIQILNQFPDLNQQSITSSKSWPAIFHTSRELLNPVIQCYCGLGDYLYSGDKVCT